MSRDALRTIGVVGAGQMGRGIAQVAARSGFTVLLHDRDVPIIEAALRSIDWRNSTEAISDRSRPHALPN